MRLAPTGSAAGHGAPRLAVAGLSKSFRETLVLDSVDLEIGDRAFVAILGPSGAGKTTLLRCLAGLATADAGDLRIDGDLVSRRHLGDRRIAFVSQRFDLVARLTALDNVLAGRLGHVAPWRGCLRRFTRRDRLLALDCLERVGLLSHATARANTLSGGQQQRVSIARALAQHPEIILADEPVASLDPSAATGVLDLLHGLTRTADVSVVCSLHQSELARTYGDRIIGLARGRKVFDGPARDFDHAAAKSLYTAGAEPKEEHAS